MIFRSRSAQSGFILKGPYDYVRIVCDRMFHEKKLNYRTSARGTMKFIQGSTDVCKIGGQDRKRHV